jgi:hypothetical protein
VIPLSFFLAAFFLVLRLLRLFGAFVMAGHHFASLVVDLRVVRFLAAGLGASQATGLGGSSPCLVKINFGCIAWTLKPALIA